MNTYGQRILTELAARWRGDNYRVERVSKTVLHLIPFWDDKPSVTTWMKEEEMYFRQKLPHLTICLIQQDGIQYELYVQDGSQDIVLTIELPDGGDGNGEKAICYVSEGDESTIPVYDVMELFSQWVQQLPAYRLQFITGQWEMEILEMVEE